MKRERAEVWVERVARWRQSGQTKRAFAMANGLNLATFGHWVRQVNTGRAAAALSVSGGGVGAGRQFVEVVGVTPRAFDAGDRIEVLLPCGAVVRVPVAFDADSLGRLLAVLEAR